MLCIFLLLSQVEIYRHRNRNRLSRGVWIAANRAHRFDCRFIEETLSRGFFQGNVGNISAAVDNTADRNRALEMPLHRRIRILLVRINGSPEAGAVKGSVAGPGNVSLAAALPVAGAAAAALAITDSGADAGTAA